MPAASLFDQVAGVAQLCPEVLLLCCKTEAAGNEPAEMARREAVATSIFLIWRDGEEVMVFKV